MLDSANDSSSALVPDGESAQEHADFMAGRSVRPYERALEDVRRGIGDQPHGAAAEVGLAHLTRHDALTGLVNRTGFLSDLWIRLSDNAPDLVPAGVLILDIDHFMAVNEGLGIAVGDEVLSIVAWRLRSTVSDTAVVARLDGDEFAVVDTFADTAAACEAATSLLAALNAPMMVGESTLDLSVSIGFAKASPGDTADGVLGRATTAVNRAKKLGRNRFEIELESAKDSTDGRLKRRGELRQAIDDSELLLFFQPQIDLANGQMSGFEALVRWDHPDRGLLDPASFIDFAEESGLILPLGAWVINAAVAQQADWHRSSPGRAPVRMSVNISAIQLNDPHLADIVTAALERHNVAAELLTLEITETALTVDPESALRTLNVLSALGVRLSIDDFGTGHSSLVYLRRFPIDELKIDRSFIAGLTSDTKDHAIVTSCIQLAHATNMSAVAEGVETADHLEALLTLGCDLAQGYFYTRPMTAVDLEPWFVPRPDNQIMSRQQLIG